MQNEKDKTSGSTEMIRTTDNPADTDEIRNELETDRFMELMYWEQKKRSLLRMILCVLVGILLTLLQPYMPFLISYFSEN